MTKLPFLLLYIVTWLLFWSQLSMDKEHVIYFPLLCTVYIYMDDICFTSSFIHRVRMNNVCPPLLSTVYG